MKKQTNKTEKKTGIELKKQTILTFEGMKNVRGGIEPTCYENGGEKSRTLGL